ncbi:related to KEX1 protein precursor [Serendipita indica DSM 11827]|uniref:Carboxypeptidase n=1 Tax=Serendipita indica (strain DSM 11827) TaxID=1109443 RepID=G4TNP6_SERID|nr:related to KEX1 protein precursor [Serendipita indica DSM 11827]
MASKSIFSLAAIAVLTFSTSTKAQEFSNTSSVLDPGMPTTPYGVDWQSYYRVTDPLPNVTFTLPTTYAGSVSVNRDGHRNSTLFFMAFEKEQGSLTAKEDERTSEPWTIWLNGGPGSSSLYGLFYEHGPMLYGLADDDTTGTRYVLRENPWSWHKHSDIFYIDQPVGTGYSTAEAGTYVKDEDQMAQDFVNVLRNLVAVFPSLKRRPLYITGESYAGTYIPYIAKALTTLSTDSPVNLAKIAIGNGAMGNYGAFVEYSVLSILQSYPALIDFNSTVYEYFVEQYNLCGYNMTLEYPARGVYPTIRDPTRNDGRSRKTGDEEPREEDYSRAAVEAMEMLRTAVELIKVDKSLDEVVVRGKRFVKKSLLEERGLLDKRQAPGLTSAINPLLDSNGSINPRYGCYLAMQLWSHVSGFILPWGLVDRFNVYRFTDAIGPPAIEDPESYLNIPAVRAALHAPRKNYVMSQPYPFGSASGTGVSSASGNAWGDPSPEPQTFLSDLAKRVPIVFFSGNEDTLVGHRGTELAIQNMTFGGIRGFTARPSTPFSDVDGNFAGIVHQERNVTYALFDGAGHMVPADRPKAAYAFFKEFILGSNSTGSVVPLSNNSSGGSVTVVGGVHTEYLKGILTATVAYTGSYRTQGTWTFGADKWAQWASYMATRTAPDVPVASATGDGLVVPGSLDGPSSSGAQVRTDGSIKVGILAIVAGFFGVYMW